MFNEVVPIVKLTIVKTQINANLRKDSIKSAFLRLSIDSRLRLLMQSHVLIEKIESYFLARNFLVNHFLTGSSYSFRQR